MAGKKLNISSQTEGGEVQDENYPQLDPELEMTEDHGLIQKAVEPQEGIEIVGAPELKQRAELDAFMEEKVTIFLEKVKGARPEELVSPCVNGRYQHCFRGVPQVVARKFVEALFRSHETSYDYDREEAIMEGDLPVPSSAPSHPFRIIRDTERGHAWFDKLVSGQL